MDTEKGGSMKPTQEQVIAWAREAGLPRLEATDEIFCLPSAISLATLAYEAGRKDENEACAGIEVNVITPVRDYTDMSPLDAYEVALMDAAVAFRAAIRARREQ